MIKIIIIITIVINFSICAIAQERYIKSEVLEFIKKEIDTKNYNSFDSTNNFHKSLKVGLYGSKLVPSSMCQFQNSNGFSSKIIWDFEEWNSVSIDFSYIFNSVENKTTNTKPSYFNEFSINYRSYLQRNDLNIFLNFGLNRFSYYNPNDGVYGDVSNSLSLCAGLGLEYLINEKISIEVLSKAYIFLSGYGLGRYYTLNLGLNYRIFKY
jgi:hypothetical protein